MTTRRLGVLGYLGAMIVLWAGQGALASMLGQAAGASQAGLALGILALQALKVFPSLWRLADVGRAPDEAIYTFVPLLNVALWARLTFSGTPSPAVRARNEATWQGQMLAVTAWSRGVQAALGTWSIALVPTLVIGALGAAGSELLAVAIEQGLPPASQDMGATVELLVGVGAFLALYSMIQSAKGLRPPYGGWLPVLLLVPTWLLAAIIGGRGATSQQLGMILATLPGMIASFTVGAAAMSVLATIWIESVSGKNRGEPGNGLMARARALFVPMWVVYGLRQQVDEIGFQILLFIPGIYFAVSYAFADILVVVDPKAAPFSTSHALVRGIRSRVLKVLVIWLMSSVTLTTLAWLPYLSPAEILSVFIGAPKIASPAMLGVSAFLGVFPSWVCTLAMVELYNERKLVLSERAEAQKRAAEERVGAAYDNPFRPPGPG